MQTIKANYLRNAPQLYVVCCQVLKGVGCARCCHLRSPNRGSNSGPAYRVSRPDLAAFVVVLDADPVGLASPALVEERLVGGTHADAAAEAVLFARSGIARQLGGR